MCALQARFAAFFIPNEVGENVTTEFVAYCGCGLGKCHAYFDVEQTACPLCLVRLDNDVLGFEGFVWSGMIGGLRKMMRS